MQKTTVKETFADQPGALTVLLHDKFRDSGRRCRDPITVRVVREQQQKKHPGLRGIEKPGVQETAVEDVFADQPGALTVLLQDEFRHRLSGSSRTTP
ncbi:hypothetical protein [Actinokineospora inagensis]|uniref:hypothetical protein n=1 Tax=Actinokineospora inagensis TaxID=103730 RepID=UPI00041A6264|nr:hypothetical protein [Actinokineospora inagensis]